MDSPQKEKSLIWTLLETASDSNGNVRQTVSSSLITLGCQHPLLVLSSLHRFLDNPQTAPKAHIQSILYNTAEGIIRDCGEKIDDTTIIDIWINNCKQLLIHPTVALDLQQAASCFLVALGSLQKHADTVIKNLIDLIRSDSIPLQSVVETIAALALSNSRTTSLYFQELLVKLLPSLPQVKQEHIRVAVCFMLGKFSEGVVDALANQAFESHLSVEPCPKECGQIYEILVQNWLRASNATLKNEVIVSLGHMSSLLSRETLELYSGTVITSILGHYRKNNCPYALTSSLALICDSLIKANISDVLKLQIDNLLSTLFSQVCVIPNYNEPFTVKNHCEVLRCYEILAKNFPDNVIAQILQRLENASHVQRVGALVVVKHLINSHSLQEEHVSKIISLMNTLLSDPNSKVVKGLTQVIVALCHNNHLKNSTGYSFVTYLVQHSAGGSLTPGRRSSLTKIGEESVGDTCCRALNLLSTTISHSTPILWPHLLQFITNLDYDESLPTVLACCSHLASRAEPLNETAAESSSIFSSLPATCSAPILMTRLLFLSYSGNSANGLTALNLLESLAGHISSSLVPLWSESCPQLKEVYSEMTNLPTDNDTMHKWQDILCQFVGSTLRCLLSDNFTSSLITAQMEQLEHYSKNQGYRSYIMALIGTSLQHSTDEALIHSTLDALYSSTNHKSSAEQESFSMTVGRCGSSHLELVLSKIESWLKATETSKRSISLLNLLKQQDLRSEEAAWIRASIVSCIGQICSLAPPGLVGSQIDGPIMLHLLNIINSNKSELVNGVILQTTSKVAKALLQLPSFKLRQRPLFLTHIVNTMKTEHISLPTLTDCLHALRDMCALEPELNIEERTIVLQAALCSSIIKLQEASTLDETLEKCYSQLNVLVRTLIQHDTNPATLDDVTTLLHSWTLSSSDIVRIKSLDLLHSAFVTYIQHVSIVHTGPTTFGQTYQLLSILTPRFGDPIGEIRSQAVSCMYLVLKIAGRYNGQSPDYSDEDLNSLKALKDVIGETNQCNVEEHLILIAKVLCSKLSFVHLRMYLSVAVSGLQDKKEEAASSVAQIFSAIFKLRGHQFHQHIKEILDSMYSRLEKVYDIETRHHAIEAICNLSRHNLNTLIDIILDYPVPYERGICETLQRLGCESELCSHALNHLTQILERTQPFTEQKTAFQDTVQIATIPSLAVICTTKELLCKLSSNKSPELSDGAEIENLKKIVQVVNVSDVSESQQVILERFPSLAALLLLTYGSYIGVMAPLHQPNNSGTSRNAFIPNRGATTLVPSKCALECLQALVGVLGCHLLEDSITLELQNSNSENLEDFLHSLANITLLLVQEVPQHISSLVAYLDTHHTHEMQRVTVTAILGQLVAEKCCGDYELLEIIMSGLLSRLNDKSLQVRRLAVRGLANFSQLQKDKMNEKINEILAALVGATDLRDSGAEMSSEGQVAQEALRGLALLLPHLSPDVIIQHTPTLLIRIRLFMEKSGEIREAAVGVLRGLASTVGHSEEFQEHIHLHLLTTLIHLVDPHPPMVVMCKSALQTLGRHISSEGINKIFQDYLVPSMSLNFQSFVAVLCKHMVVDLVEQVPLFIQATTSYFRHSEAPIRRASILLVGNLIYNYEQEVENATLHRIATGMIALMRDADSSVRTAAALSVPFLFRHEKYL